MKTYLNVSYQEKDIVKQMGAKWDGIRRQWYVENIEHLDKFVKWIPVLLLKATIERSHKKRR
jgi:exodeoxyribonuclease VII large subunit